jgi:hypothetical protein
LNVVDDVTGLRDLERLVNLRLFAGRQLTVTANPHSERPLAALALA